ncbi:hypothetical protein Q5P01_000296 [Channa striata]|uniref:Uncharacterized protein n=1 Tax=Channa striata TaxID=64152 RepID=A0AA88IH81_CHASR|nr:hypothetical protein Q5P01_000296 [Channa striata]
MCAHSPGPGKEIFKFFQKLRERVTVPPCGPGLHAEKLQDAAPPCSQPPVELAPACASVSSAPLENCDPDSGPRVNTVRPSQSAGPADRPSVIVATEHVARAGGGSHAIPATPHPPQQMCHSPAEDAVPPPHASPRHPDSAEPEQVPALQPSRLEESSTMSCKNCARDSGSTTPRSPHVHQQAAPV